MDEGVPTGEAEGSVELVKVKRLNYFGAVYKQSFLKHLCLLGEGLKIFLGISSSGFFHSLLM